MTEFSRSARKFYRFALSLTVLIILGLVLAACGDAASTVAPATTAATTSAATTQAATTTSAATASTSTPVVANATTAATSATTAAASTTSSAAKPTNTAAATTAASGSATPAKPTPTAIPVPTVVVPKPALDALDVVAQQASKVRQLTFKTPIEKFYVTRAAFAKYQTASFNQENPPEEIARSQKINEAFGFIPKGYDLTKAYNDFSSSAVQGFYDPRTKKFYVVVDGDPNTITTSIKVTAEHELTHALQDQYFDTLKLRDLRQPGSTEGNDDRDAAILALLEGDAVLSQTLWLQAGNLKAAELKQFIDENNAQVKEVEAKIKDLPLIIKEAQYFPYLDGASFIQNAYRKGGWDAINKMFTDYAPRSTSQILHPEKFDRRIEPAKIDLLLLTDTLGQGWKLIEFNTMGELQTSILLKGGAFGYGC